MKKRALAFALALSSLSCPVALAQGPAPPPYAGGAHSSPPISPPRAARPTPTSAAASAALPEADYATALIEFRRAYEIDPRYQVLYNVGETHDQLQDYAERSQDLRASTSATGSARMLGRPPRRVQKEIDKLRTRVASLEVTLNLPDVEISVDDVPVGKSPLPAPLVVSAGRPQGDRDPGERQARRSPSSSTWPAATTESSRSPSSDEAGPPRHGAREPPTSRPRPGGAVGGHRGAGGGRGGDRRAGARLLERSQDQARRVPRRQPGRHLERAHARRSPSPSPPTSSSVQRRRCPAWISIVPHRDVREARTDKSADKASRAAVAPLLLTPPLSPRGLPSRPARGRSAERRALGHLLNRRTFAMQTSTSPAPRPRPTPRAGSVARRRRGGARDDLLVLVHRRHAQSQQCQTTADCQPCSPRPARSATDHAHLRRRGHRHDRQRRQQQHHRRRAAGGCDVDGGIDGGGCYACPPTSDPEYLNACTTGCIAFDNTRVTKLDGGVLPPLPLPGPDGGM